jgi:predicted patatin/cPLA2 family phospholipase
MTKLDHLDFPLLLSPSFGLSCPKNQKILKIYKISRKKSTSFSKNLKKNKKNVQNFLPEFEKSYLPKNQKLIKIHKISRKKFTSFFKNLKKMRKMYKISFQNSKTFKNKIRKFIDLKKKNNQFQETVLMSKYVWK